MDSEEIKNQAQEIAEEIERDCYHPGERGFAINGSDWFDTVEAIAVISRAIVAAEQRGKATADQNLLDALVIAMELLEEIDAEMYKRGMVGYSRHRYFQEVQRILAAYSRSLADK